MLGYPVPVGPAGAVGGSSLLFGPVAAWAILLGALVASCALLWLLTRSTEDGDQTARAEKPAPDGVTSGVRITLRGRRRAA
jgi:hypothetical protein